jgi:hypothetical protein
MDDFDAKNHLRDVHREADLSRLARLAQVGAPPRQPGWLSKQVGRLLYALGNRLAGLGKRMAAADVPLVEQPARSGEAH